MRTWPEVTCIGELIVDFVSIKTGVGLSNSPGFFKAAGGAAANVSVGLARLGTQAAFVGRVGADPFGRFLAGELAKAGVDVTGIRFDRDRKTRLAFVSLTASGEREFVFWEQQPADEQIRPTDINLSRVARSRIVHVSSFLLLREPARSTALRVAQTLRRRGCMISFDPNLRLSLWKSPTEAKQILLRMVRLSHLLRLNEEEARFLGGVSEVRRAAERLRRFGPQVVIVTQGQRGCYYSSDRAWGHVPGFRVAPIDTTGCGDGFLAGVLHSFLAENVTQGDISNRELRSVCRFANAVGAYVATERGAIAAMPRRRSIERFIARKVTEAQ